MDAVALPVHGRVRTRESVGDLQSGSHMVDKVVANGHIRYPATGTSVGSLRCEHDRKSYLRETTPRAFQHVASEQNSLRTFQREKRLDDKCASGSPPHISCMPPHPA